MLFRSAVTHTTCMCSLKLRSAERGAAHTDQHSWHPPQDGTTKRAARTQALPGFVPRKMVYGAALDGWMSQKTRITTKAAQILRGTAVDGARDCGDSDTRCNSVRRRVLPGAQKGVRKVVCAFCLCMSSSSRKRDSLAFASAARSSHALGYLQSSCTLSPSSGPDAGVVRVYTLAIIHCLLDVPALSQHDQV